MFLQMRDVFQKHDLVAERNVIEQHEMLVQLAHVANVGNHRQAKLLRHQADGEKLAHAREPGAIRLHEMHATVMEEVLEENCGSECVHLLLFSPGRWHARALRARRHRRGGLALRSRAA